MNVFIPHKKDLNIYLDQIINYATCNYIFGNLEKYKPAYEVVNIQFPEAIFDWIPPSEKQIHDLERRIINWKIKSKIILTLNDLESHYDTDNKFNSLFKLIQKHADGVIHLGKYSLKKYKHLFPKNCKHQLIYHPLYLSLLNNTDEFSFEEKFNIVFKNKYVVSGLGNIRSMEEAKLLLKIFKKIPVKNKLLIVPKMYHFQDTNSFRPYRFRKIYKYIFEKLICFPLKKEQYFFGNKFLEYGYMVDLVRNSSLMIIPRIKNLNSGNLFLGLTFDKPMVIPKIGNLTEVAEYFNLPTLDLEKGNYNEVLSTITDKKINKIFESDEYELKKEQFHPKIIAQEHERFYKSLMNV